MQKSLALTSDSKGFFSTLFPSYSRERKKLEALVKNSQRQELKDLEKALKFRPLVVGGETLLLFVGFFIAGLFFKALITWGMIFLLPALISLFALPAVVYLLMFTIIQTKAGKNTLTQIKAYRISADSFAKDRHFVEKYRVKHKLVGNQVKVALVAYGPEQELASHSIEQKFELFQQGKAPKTQKRIIKQAVFRLDQEHEALQTAVEWDEIAKEFNEQSERQTLKKLQLAQEKTSAAKELHQTLKEILQS